MVSIMIRQFCSLLVLTGGLGLAQEDSLRPQLEGTYEAWRHSLQTRNDAAWRKITAQHRVMAVKNRILSEKRDFPAAVFELPALPPRLEGLNFLGIQRRGPTAKSYYYGPIDFGQGRQPVDNLLVLSFVGAVGSWKFDQVEYINLVALPEVRAELAKGDIQYITSTPELMPSGVVPATPVEVREAPYIAKVYAYCPGREVKVQVNQLSQHVFSNTQQAELVMGGARHGVNRIQFAVTKLEPGELTDPMTVRVYLMSQVHRVKPIKIYEYLIEEGQQPQGFIKGEFTVDDPVRARLMGR